MGTEVQQLLENQLIQCLYNDGQLLYVGACETQVFFEDLEFFWKQKVLYKLQFLEDS
jgi:hypothetical protein